MKATIRLGGLLLALWTTVVGAASRQFLVAIGGGGHPPEAMRAFVEAAGGPKARLLVITWASSYAPETFGDLKKELEALKPQRVEIAPSAGDIDDRTEEISKQIEAATGIYLAGGSQTRLMKAVEKAGVLGQLRRKYQQGTAFCGTSAGTAAMPKVMMTGEADLTVIDSEAVKTTEGLGFLTDVILDQHFLERRRANRLLSLLQREKEATGIGIDRSTAVLIRDNRSIKVVGESKVLVIEPSADGKRRMVELLSAGDTYELGHR